MSELLDVLGGPGVVDETALVSSLESLDVRQTWLDGFLGRGSLASFVPTPEEWDAQRPQAIGRDIRDLLADGEARLRIFSLNDAALTRRKETLGRLGLTYKRVKGEDPICGAEVTGVTDIAFGKDWSRTMPLLQLAEHTDMPSDQEFIVSVSDMAYYIQSEQAEIEIQLV